MKEELRAIAECVSKGNIPPGLDLWTAATRLADAYLAQADAPALEQPNLAYEEIAAKLRASIHADDDGKPEGTLESLKRCAIMLDTYGRDCFPANEKGQVHFARAMMESVTDEIYAYLANVEFIPFVQRPTGRTIPDLTKREHICEWQGKARATQANAPALKPLPAGKWTSFGYSVIRGEEVIATAKRAFEARRIAALLNSRERLMKAASEVVALHNSGSIVSQWPDGNDALDDLRDAVGGESLIIEADAALAEGT